MGDTEFTVQSWQPSDGFKKKIIIFRGIGHLGCAEVFNVPASQVNEERLAQLNLPAKISKPLLDILDEDNNVVGTLRRKTVITANSSHLKGG